MKVLAGGGEGKNLRTTASFSFKFLHAKKIGDPSRVARRLRARREKNLRTTTLLSDLDPGK